MKFELDEHHRNVADGELLADLRHVALKINKTSITRREQDELGRFSSSTLVRRFGNWFVILEKAGLQGSTTPPNTPEEKLLRNLEEVWIKLGRQPLSREVRKPLSIYESTTYKRRFGSWRNALKTFASSINEEESASKHEPNQPILSKTANWPQGPRNINWRLRFIVMRRDNFKCKVCGRSPANDPTITLDVDHIKAWSKGGRTVLENLQTLCTKCNIGKSDLEFFDSSANEAQNVEA